MSRFNDDVGAKQYPNDASCAATSVPMSAWGDTLYPLFPDDGGGAEHQEIQFVTFCRRRRGNTVERPDAPDCFELLRDWRDVLMWYGSGAYKAFGLDAQRRVVAVYPGSEDDWLIISPVERPWVGRLVRNAASVLEAFRPPPAAAPPVPATPPLEAEPPPLEAELSPRARAHRALLRAAAEMGRTNTALIEATAAVLTLVLSPVGREDGGKAT